MDQRPWLRALCEAVGVTLVYHDVTGREHRLEPAAAEALLSAMGLEAGTEEAAQTTLRRLDAEQAHRLLAPATVLPIEEGGVASLPLALPADPGPTRWHLRVLQENGRASEFSGEDTGATLVPLEGIGHGYHTGELRTFAPDRVEEASIIVTPGRCWTAEEALGGARGFGVWANLYSVRSAENWGIGDFGDLRRLVELTAAAGGAFVGVNPLHALRNRGDEISPYSPLSRLFRNPAYASVPEVPEFADCPAAQALVASGEFQAELAALRAADRIDYDRVRTAKERVLRLLYAEFRSRHLGRGTQRGRAFGEFVEREGRALDEYATFLTLDSHLAVDGVPVYWREWPEQYRDRASPAVSEFRTVHAAEVDWHRWLQFELDRQLGLAADCARTAGMPIGLYQDLAVGTSDGGSDVWAFQHLFDRGVTIGAPPDDYAVSGQDWGLPPLDPNRMRRHGYRYWTRLARGGFRHAGALRIDHAMGLARLYWIPPGLPATEGAYVAYPAEDLLAILALESRRHRAVVIAEDLGTVPAGFEALLERWGLLSSRVLWFEREDGGGFRPQEAYLARALVTTTTHDHAPLAGWITANDIAVRREIGMLSDEEADRAADWRRHERASLLDRLRTAGVLEPGDGEPGYPALLAAVHAFIAGTPARLVGVSLDDLAGELDPVNIPGVGPDRYPAWSRRMRASLEDLARDEAVRTALDSVRAVVRPG